MGLKEKDLNKKITCVEYKPEIYFDRVSDADIARVADMKYYKGISDKILDIS